MLELAQSATGKANWGICVSLGGGGGEGGVQESISQLGTTGF